MRQMLGKNLCEITGRFFSREGIEHSSLTFDILLDTEREVYSEYHVSMVPYTLLIDQEKVIRYSRLGFKDGDQKVLEEKVRSLLKLPEDSTE